MIFLIDQYQKWCLLGKINFYSSRAPIPANKSGEFNFWYKHVCVYAFNKEHLSLFTKNKNKTLFEEEEDLEIDDFELGVNVNCIELKNAEKLLIILKIS